MARPGRWIAAFSLLLLGIAAGGLWLVRRESPTPPGPPTEHHAAQTVPPPERQAARPTGLPILLIGLDAADGNVIQPLVERGDLPQMGSLMERGASGVLLSEEPMVSALLWTTIATGRDPLDHGVLDFLEVDPASGEPMPVTARQRRAPALWDVFASAGLESTVVAWWASWPAYPVAGRIVSDRVAYSVFDWAPDDPRGAGLFHPADLAARLLPLRIAAAGIGPGDLAPLARVPPARFEQADRALAAGASPFGDPVNHLRHVLASSRSYHAMALRLLGERQTPLVAVYYEAIDEVQHLFAHCRPPAMPTCPPALAGMFGGTVEAFYRLQDRMIGDLLAAADPRTVVIVVSDHGFRAGPDRPRDSAPAIGGGHAARWHRREGIFLLAGPPILPGPIGPRSIRDVAPTVLYLAGLPLDASLAGEPILDAVSPEFRAAHPPVRIDAYSPFRLEAAVAAAPDADREGLEKLRALGYLGGLPEASAPRGERATYATVHRLNTEAFLHARRGEDLEARRLLRRALDLDPDFLPARLSLADLEHRTGRPDEAVAIYRQVLDEAWPDEPQAFPRAANAFAAAGMAREGIEHLRSLADAHPDAVPLQVSLAIVQRAAGDATAAERTLRGVLDRDPLSAEAMHHLFELLGDAGRLEDAVPLLKRALALDPASAPHHRWLGRIAEAKGRLGEAGLHYARASAAAPSDFGPVADLGRVTGLSGRLREAAGIFESAQRRFPAEPRASYQLGIARQALGDLAGARAAFEEAARRGLRSADLHRRLGRVAAAAGDRAAAREHLARSLEIDPDQPDVTRDLEALRREP